jgi:hypothetical protein
MYRDETRPPQHGQDPGARRHEADLLFEAEPVGPGDERAEDELVVDQMTTSIVPIAQPIATRSRRSIASAMYEPTPGSLTLCP